MAENELAGNELDPAMERERRHWVLTKQLDQLFLLNEEWEIFYCLRIVCEESGLPDTVVKMLHVIFLLMVEGKDHAIPREPMGVEVLNESINTTLRREGGRELGRNFTP
jgi:hypothetical protein